MVDAKQLRRITLEFNKYRAPECKARVLLNKDNTLTVEFTGTKASHACCFDENFIDYQYYLKDLAKKSFEINKIKRKAPERFMVIYKLEMRRCLNADQRSLESLVDK